MQQFSEERVKFPSITVGLSKLEIITLSVPNTLCTAGISNRKYYSLP